MRRNYSKYLNDFCTTYRLSGAQVARMVGMAEETIQAIRRGERKPQQATKDKLNRFILNYKKENQPMTPITSQETQTDIVGIDSRTVAEWTGKNHFDLMRDIRQYSEYLKNADLLSTDFWQETTYTASNGKENPCYMITKKGCEFIQHKMTGQKGAVFTAKYINYFWEQGEQLQEATQILLDLSDQPTQPAIELNSDMAYIKNRLAELQSMTTMADIKVGLAKTYRIAELMED
ncbi:TPA: Rha family transcriptional regulator [Streptococcus suis]